MQTKQMRLKIFNITTSLISERYSLSLAASAHISGTGVSFPLVKSTIVSSPPPGTTKRGGCTMAASTSSASGEEEDVFEIREWVDDEGKEVSSEVYSVREAARQVKKLDLLGVLEKAAAANKKASTAAAIATEVKEAERAAFGNNQTPTSNRDVNNRVAADSESSNASSNGCKTGASLPSSTQQLLDDHDWEGIKERASEIQSQQFKSIRGELEAEADSRQGRNKLEGSGWGKGFFLSTGRERIGGNSSGTESTTKPTKSCIKSPVTKTARVKKHVSFDLHSAPASRESLDFLPRRRIPCEPEVEEEKDEDKRLEAQRRQAWSGTGFQGKLPETSETKPAGKAFSGLVTEVDGCGGPRNGGGERIGPELTSRRSSSACSMTDRSGIAPPGMSRFKARALGVEWDGGSA